MAAVAPSDAQPAQQALTWPLDTGLLLGVQRLFLTRQELLSIVPVERLLRGTIYYTLVPLLFFNPTPSSRLLCNTGWCAGDMGLARSAPCLQYDVFKAICCGSIRTCCTPRAAAHALERRRKPLSVLEGGIVRLKRSGAMGLHRIASVKECGSHMEILTEVTLDAV